MSVKNTAQNCSMKKYLCLILITIGIISSSYLCTIFSTVGFLRLGLPHGLKAGSASVKMLTILDYFLEKYCNVIRRWPNFLNVKKFAGTQFVGDIFCRKSVEQAGAELCQAQFKLGLAKTAFPDVDIVFVFVFPVLKV